MRKVKYKKFYSGKLSLGILEKLDNEHRIKMKLLVEELKHGSWTVSQIKRQKSSILPNIALYKVFMDNGISKNEAQELVKEYAFYRAEKAHNILSAFFSYPRFLSCFQIFHEKGNGGR